MSDWRKSAACAGYDPALWFPGNSQLMRREAIHICHTCPVMRFFSPQTRYFNAGLGRIEFCVW